MTDPRKKIILLVDDDEDDFILIRDIFKESHPDVHLEWMKDGEEALTYLEGAPGVPEKPRPSLILLDLNMPKLNGREVLNRIRSRESISHVPVVVFSNSMDKSEVLDVYRLGVNSFVRKPAGYKELRDFADVFYRYWFQYSTLI
jgi:CheY-like chemotaxis protein